jgi:hypothetical protein
MEKTLISWNVPNLITIWLMLAIGFLLLTLATSAAGNWFNGRNDNSAA